MIILNGINPSNRPGIIKSRMSFADYLFYNGEEGAYFDFTDTSTMYQNVDGTTPVTAVGDPVGYIESKAGDRTYVARAVDNNSRPTYDEDENGIGRVRMDYQRLEVGETEDFKFANLCFCIGLETHPDLGGGSYWPFYKDNNNGYQGSYAIYETRGSSGFLTFSGVNVEGESGDIYRWDANDQINWRENSETISPRYAHQSCSDGRYVYVFGGRNDSFDWFNQNGALRDFYRYEPGIETIEELPVKNGPPATSGGLMLNYHDDIYLIGGTSNRSSGVDAYQSMWRYNKTRRRWYEATQPPFSKYWICGAVDEDNLYVLGGYNSQDSNSDLIHRYNITEDTWYEMGSIPYAANSQTATILNHSIYLHGGYNGSYLASFYRGDINDDYSITWTQLSDSPIGKTSSGMSSDAENNAIFLYAGKTDSGGITDSIEWYDIDNATWNSFDSSDIQIPRTRFLTADMCQGKFVIIGGFDGNEAVGNINKNHTTLGFDGAFSYRVPRRRVQTIDNSNRTEGLVGRFSNWTNKVTQQQEFQNNGIYPLILGSRQGGAEAWYGYYYHALIGNNLNSRYLEAFELLIKDQMNLNTTV